VLGVSLATVKNWENGRTTVGEASYARVVRFLGHDPNPAPRSLAERLRAARRAMGISQKTLALKLGLDPSTVRAWEAGRGSVGHGRVRHVLEEFVATVPFTPPEE
jgi:transcriptional regulator with XRE-family HTH domain